MTGMKCECGSKRTKIIDKSYMCGGRYTTRTCLDCDKTFSVMQSYRSV